MLPSDIGWIGSSVQGIAGPLIGLQAGPGTVCAHKFAHYFDLAGVVKPLQTPRRLHPSPSCFRLKRLTFWIDWHGRYPADPVPRLGDAQVGRQIGYIHSRAIAPI